MHWGKFTVVVLAVGTFSAAAEVTVQRGALRLKEGQVTFQRPPAAAQAAPVPQSLDFGDQLQTAELSWAVVEFTDLSRLKVRELSVLEFVKPSVLVSRPGLKIQRGAAYVSDLPRFREFQVQTPHSKVTPSGTEFLIEVRENETQVVMFDGEAELESEAGSVVVRTGEQGVARPGQAPQTARLEAKNLVQWWLYYPGVVDPDELKFSAEEQALLADSLAAYRSGHLPEALKKFPGYPAPVALPSDTQKIYFAGLLLSVAAIDKAQAALDGVSAESGASRALRVLIAAVTGGALGAARPTTASEWLAVAYAHQSRFELEDALRAARTAVEQSPNFAFGWARVAELEFGFGRTGPARRALGRSLALAPRNGQMHALNGFLLAAEGRLSAALEAFEEAIRLDPALGNAWLGRGLVRIRRGDAAAGREDLQMATVLEPNRSLLHSYLGKALMQAKELEFAKRLDPNDPTPWLYSALLNREANRINLAVEELEHSVELNDNRAVYRSRLLLDADRAVRSSSLANLYQSAGMNEVSVREAARAVSFDYANHSAHQFMAESLNALRDPTRFNLRYETAWFNEFLLASLLAPVGATPLSQHVSQQEYARLFEQDGFGLSSDTEYRSDGQVRELASQYGTFGRTGYSLDLDYQHNDGVRPNNELDRIEWYSTLKHQLSPQDSVLLLAKYQNYHSGDNFQYYDPRNARRDFLFDESQKPILLGGYHREWTPGVHTMMLGGRLENDQTFKDRQAPLPVLFKDTTINPAGEIVAKGAVNFDVRHRSELEVYFGELQQVFEHGPHVVLAGGRYQRGEIVTHSRVFNPSSGMALFDDPPADLEFADDLERATAYGYYTLEAAPRLRLTGGLAYEHLRFPENFRSPPIEDGEQTRDRLNPKGALVWDPIPELTLRGVYTRSLGGVSLDQSYRLEPTQLAGFSQAFRTIIPESLVGSVEAPDYETVGAGLDVKLKTRTYLGVQGEWLTADVKRNVGVFDFVDFTPPIRSSSTRQHLDYEEWSARAVINQLVSDEWSVGLSYRFTRSELDSVFPDIPMSLPPEANRSDQADLHQAGLFVLFNHPSGFFARAESIWYVQSNSGSVTNLPGETFAQVNFFAGYRFPRQRGDITLGGLNLTGEDYRLNPLTPYTELPRERVFLARLRFNF